MLRSFQQFWGKGVPQKVVVIAVAGVLVTCSCCGLGAVVLAAIGASLGPVAQPVQTVSTRTVVVQEASTPTNTTALPTSTPTRQPTATSVPSGPPYVGGPFSNFTAKYGQPTPNGTSANFWADGAQTISLNVSPTSGTVTYVVVVGPDSWTNDQSFAFCSQFLPSDATEYNHVDPNTDYHSSVGDLEIGNYGVGTCVVILAQ